MRIRHFVRGLFRFLSDLPKNGEIATAGSDFAHRWQTMAGGVLEPDDEILREIAPARMKRGKNELHFDPWQLFRIMRRADPKIKSLFGQRKAAVISKGWMIAPNSGDKDEARAVEVANFVEAALRGIKNFEGDLQELLSAVPVGWALSEVIWEEREIATMGGSRTAWVPKELKQRRQGRFGFTADGELKYQPEQGVWESMPALKFVVYSHAPENEGAYGLAEAAEVWWWWFFKHMAVKWWQIFNEKYGMPTVVGYVPAGTSKKEKEDLLGNISRLVTEFALVIPKNFDAKLMEAQRDGSVNTYKEFIELADRVIAEAVTGQSLATGQATTGTGTMAQSVVHNEVRQEVVQADSLELMGVFDSQLVRWLVDLNFGTDVPAPYWMIPYAVKDQQAKAALYKNLQEMGHRFGQRWLAAEFDLPYLEEDSDDPEAEPRGGGGDLGIWGGLGDGGAGDDEGGGEDGDDEAKEKRNAKARRTRRRGGVGEPVRHAVDGKSKGELKRRQKETSAVGGRAVKLGAEAAGKLAELILEEAEKAGTLEELQRKLGGLQVAVETEPVSGEAMAAAKVAGWLVGAAQEKRYADEAREEDDDEEDEEGEQKGAGRPVTEAGGKSIGDFKPVAPKAAISWFEKLVPFTRAMLDKVADQARRAAFLVSGIIEARVVGRIKDLVGDAIKDGTTLADFRKDLGSLLAAEGEGPLRRDRVETLFRTEIARAYGAGRTEALRSEEVKGAFPMLQYIAIKDQRTRDEHRALDGFLADPDDPIWQTKTPPWEPNCRCDVVPVTKRQVRDRGLTASTTVTMPDGSEVDPRTWPTSPGFRGIGF